MSGAPDFSKMSDADLLAYIHATQPAGPPATPDAATAPVAPPQPVEVSPLPAPEGTNGRGTSMDRNAPAPPGPSALKTLNNGIVSAADGIPILGAFADEADAATDAAIAPAVEPVLRHAPHLVQALLGYDPKQEIGNIPSFQGRYDAARNLQRFNADQFHEQHPVADTGLKVGGAVAGTVAMLPALAAGTAAAGPEAGLLARALTGAAEGGAIGGVDSYGRGNGAWDDPSRVHGAEVGGMLGAGAGLALPVASQVAKTAYGASVGKIVDALRGSKVIQAPAEDEAARLSAILRGEPTDATAVAVPDATAGATPDRLSTEAALIAAKRALLTVNASNVDDAYMRIARAAARQEMTPAEMASASQAVGPLGVMADTGESARDLLRAAMNRPGAGATIAEENLIPRQNGIFSAESGSWLVRPSSMRITDQAKTGLDLEGKDYHAELDNLLAARKEAADPAYDAMRAHPPVPATDLADFSGSPMFQSAYDDARKIAAKTFVKLPDGTEKIVPLPEEMPSQFDWRTLDLMKQAMDDTISTSRQQGIGATSQGASKGYLQRFVGKLDSLNPDYATARDAFSGPTAMRDALQEGRGLLSEDAPTVAADVASRPESEKQMLRLGAYQALQSKLGNANVTFDAANQAGLMKPNQLARFQALFPDQKSFADFYRTMENEHSMFATNKAAFGNSTTAKQMLNVAEPSDPRLEGLARVTEAVPEGNIMGLIRGIHQFGQESPMSEDTAATIASVLSRHMGTGELPAVIAKMEQARRAAAMADLVRQSNGTIAGETAARKIQANQ